MTQGLDAKVAWDIGGTASGVTVLSGGEIELAGGTVARLTVDRGAIVDAIQTGDVYVSAGQTASGAVISSGVTQTVLSGGSTLGTIISGGGNETVSAGGVASGTTAIGGATDWGVLNVYGSALDAAAISGGLIEVYSGGITTSSLVSGSAAISNDTYYPSVETVYSGGSAIDTIVGARAELYVTSGGAAIGTGSATMSPERRFSTFQPAPVR